MATIAELAQMASNVYKGTASATQNTSALLTGLTGWDVGNISISKDAKHLAMGSIDHTTVWELE